MDGKKLYQDNKHNFNIQINDCVDEDNDYIENAGTDIGVMMYSSREVNIISTKSLGKLRNKMFVERP